MIIEIAIGDAYGAAFEYVDERFVQEKNNLKQYYKHPRHRLLPGKYTDDTQMSIAIAELIIAGTPWTPVNIAFKFVEVFHRDQREGYARGFYDFLRSVRTGEEFVQRIRPDSDKSGAAMRACPIGVFPTVEEVKQKATVQAKLTHDTPMGINAAVAAALTSHYFVYRHGPRADLGHFIEKHVPGRQWSKPWTGEVGPKGWMSVSAAISALQSSKTLSELLRLCVSFGGDVDTVAAIALGAASGSQEFDPDLPLALIAGLEKGPYGKSYLERLDHQLAAKRAEIIQQAAP
jgi:ADP-ribosyl-[dinitrogen reductase] hydrolase